MENPLLSQKPYLFRAIYDWIVDNSMTPYLLVDATIPGAQLPTEYIEGGEIVLNVSPNAVRNFHCDNDWVSFSTRFAGKSMEVFIPLIAVESVYSLENGAGMAFGADAEDAPEVPPEPPNTPTSTKAELPRRSPSGRPALSIVKK